MTDTGTFSRDINARYGFNHDPKEIPKVVSLVEEGKADLVIGSRFLEKS
jgi:hypothetical protein